MKKLATPGLAFAGAVVGVSCALTFPDYDLEQSGTTNSTSSSSSGGGGGGGGAAAPFAENGDPCTSPGECFSGNCLPNNTAPGNVCCAIDCLIMDAATCGTNGKCDASGADCALYSAGTDCSPTTCEDDSLTTAQCQAAACTAEEKVPCEDGVVCGSGASCLVGCLTTFDCANPADVGAGAECTDDGDCIERPRGAPCDSDDQCISGVCGTTGIGRCCTAPCPETESICGATDCDETGACVYPSTVTPCDALPACEGSDLRGHYCNGDGACGAESTQECPGHLGCADATSCYSACGSNDATGDLLCAPGYWCDGSTCHPASWDEGSSCLRDGQCRSNDCSPEGLCAAADCDFDGDGELRDDALCGGQDCDDSDARVWPGQQEFFDTPRASGGYDFDCNGVDEGNHATSCACAGQLLAVPAGGAGCSVTGRLVNCVQFFLCGVSDTGVDATQLCR